MSRSFPALLLLPLLALAGGCPKKTDAPTPPVATVSAPATSAGARDGGAAARHKPTPDEEKRFRAALKSGRELAKKGDHAGAIVAFGEALKIFPDDPRALDELGLAAFRQKDLPTAEKMAQRAAQMTVDPRQRGSALYNLGRVQEERGEKAQAIESYRRSLADRPNKIVRERLATLDPAAAAEKDVATPGPMEGPFASVAKFCAKNSMKAECDQYDTDTDDADDNSGDGDDKKRAEYKCEEGQKLGKVAAPLQTVEIVDTSCDRNDGHELRTTRAFLALQVGGKWYIDEIGGTLNSWRQDETLEVTKLEARSLVPGGATRVVINTSNTSMYRGLDSTSHERLLVAGVGASGVPSLTAPLLLSQSANTDDEETGETKSTSGADLKAQFLAGEVLEIAGPHHVKGSGIDRAILERLLGKHALLFP